MIESVEALRRDDHHRAARAAKGFEMTTEKQTPAAARDFANQTYLVALRVYHAARADYRVAVRENVSVEDLKYFHVRRLATAQAAIAAAEELHHARAFCY